MLTSLIKDIFLVKKAINDDDMPTKAILQMILWSNRIDLIVIEFYFSTFECAAFVKQMIIIVIITKEKKQII